MKNSPESYEEFVGRMLDERRDDAEYVDQLEKMRTIKEILAIANSVGVDANSFLRAGKSFDELIEIVIKKIRQNKAAT